MGVGWFLNLPGTKRSAHGRHFAVSQGLDYRWIAALLIEGEQNGRVDGYEFGFKD